MAESTRANAQLKIAKNNVFKVSFYSIFVMHTWSNDLLSLIDTWHVCKKSSLQFIEPNTSILAKNEFIHIVSFGGYCAISKFIKIYNLVVRHGHFHFCIYTSIRFIPLIAERERKKRFNKIAEKMITSIRSCFVLGMRQINFLPYQLIVLTLS